MQINQVDEGAIGRSDFTNGAGTLLGGNYHAESVRNEEIGHEQDAIGCDILQPASVGSADYGAQVAELQNGFLAYQNDPRAEYDNEFLGFGRKGYHYPESDVAHGDCPASSEARVHHHEEHHNGDDHAFWIKTKQNPPRSNIQMAEQNTYSKLKALTTETSFDLEETEVVCPHDQRSGATFVYSALNNIYMFPLAGAASQQLQQLGTRATTGSAQKLIALGSPVSSPQGAASSALQSPNNQISTSSSQPSPSATADEETSYSKAGVPILPGKKKQTKPPHKRVPPPPRARAPAWPDYYTQTPEIQANPGGWEAAHTFIIRRQDIPGLLNIGGELISSHTGDWKSRVRNSFLNAWILKQHNLVLFTGGGKDHGPQNVWHDARSEQERDEIRIYIMKRIEEKLLPWMKDRVKRERETLHAVNGSLNTSVHDGSFWANSPVVGVPQVFAPQFNGIRLASGGASGGGLSGSVPKAEDLTASSATNDARDGRSPARGPSTSGNNSRGNRKRERRVDDTGTEFSGELPDTLPKTKKLHRSIEETGRMNSTPHPSSHGRKFGESHQGSVNRVWDEDENDSDYQEREPRLQKRSRNR